MAADAAGAPEDRIGLGAAVGLGAIVLATFVAITTEVVPVGLLPQLSRALAVPESVTGLLLTVYAALVALLALPLTALTGRIARKPLLLGTILLYAASNLVIALAPGFAVVCVGRAVGGIAHALFFSVSSAYAAALVPPRVQGRAIAVAASGASLGYVLGVPLVTAIGGALDWRVAFGALALGGAVVALVTGGLLPAVPTAAAPAERLTVRAAGPLAAVAVATSAAFAGHYAVYTFVSPLLLRAGLPERALGAVLFLLGAAGVLGLWLAGLVIDRRPRTGFLAALALAVCCVAALGIARGSTAGAIAMTVAWLVAFGAIPTFCTAAALRTRIVSPDLSAAVNNASSNVGIGGGAALGAAAWAAGGPVGVVALGAGGFAVAFGLVLALRRGFPARPPA